MAELQALQSILSRTPFGAASASASEDSDEQRARRDADAINRSSREEPPPDGWQCNRCNNRGLYAVPVQYGGHWTVVMEPCKCMHTRRALRKLAESGMKDAAKRLTFENFVATEPWQVNVLEKVQAYLSAPAGTWLYIGGQSGSGKTHLCTAVAIKLIKQEKDVYYMPWREEAMALKRCATESEAYEQQLRRLREADVLYIDDLFKGGAGQVPTAADLNLAFEIVNRRYNDPAKVTIISSELPMWELTKLDEAIAGRIAERAGVYCVNIERDRKKNYRLAQMTEV